MKVSANSLHLTVIAIFWLLLVGATVTPVIAQNHYNTVPVPTAFVLGIPGSPATIGPNVNITNEPGRKLKPALLSISPNKPPPNSPSRKPQPPWPSDSFQS